MKKRVDYDKIAPTFNQRYADNQIWLSGEAISRLAEQLNTRRALEVGCGTGHWLAYLSEEVPRLVGLDLSRGMLAQAQRRQTHASWVQGDASTLPFPREHFDLLFCINALHNFDDPPQFLAEAFRVLCPGGALAVLGSDPRREQHTWYVYQYFQGTYETDLERFPDWQDLTQWMNAVGFTGLVQEDVEHINNPKLGRRVLEDPFLEKTATSQLALLSEEEYETGLDCIKTTLQQAEARGETLSFASEFTITMLTGWKP
jgi:ubiquinone/menaquinone biosynthesis C-methylase UbiE